MKGFEFITNKEFMDAHVECATMRQFWNRVNEIISDKAQRGTVIKGGEAIYDQAICGNVHYERHQGDDHFAWVFMERMPEEAKPQCSHRRIAFRTLPASFLAGIRYEKVFNEYCPKCGEKLEGK